MKVSTSAVKAIERKESRLETPPLSLVPDEEEIEEDDATKKVSFKLFTNPAAAAAAAAGTHSPKFTFSMAIADGTQSIRFQIKWTENVQKVLKGLGTTNGDAAHEMVQQLCKGLILTQYNQSVTDAVQKHLKARAQAAADALVQDAADTDEEHAVKKDVAFNTNIALGPDPVPMNDLRLALQSTIGMVCPYKALEKQKRFMRRKMRKPADMRIRTYVNHLHRINFEELLKLPPYKPTQILSLDELLDIVLFGIPKSWTKEMDRQDFDPYAGTLIRVVEFCERIESSEDFVHGQTEHPKKNPGNSKFSHSKKAKTGTKDKSSSKTGMWCEYHDSSTHNTSDCSVLQKMKANGKANRPDQKKSGFGNKTWTKKSDDAKKFTKKELNAIVKKASTNAVKFAKRDMKVVAEAKRKKSSKDSDDDSTASVNVVERMEAGDANNMDDVDEQMKNFSFKGINHVDV
jgi:hypothetical protein